MVNLAEVIKSESPDKVINAWYEANNKPRTWLGLSQIGHQCERYLWYCHHGYTGEQPEGRVLRLFQLGNILEDQTILDLKTAGFIHHSGQKEVTFTNNGVTLQGHIDGIVEGLLESGQPHLFEHKTCCEKKFKELLKLNSYERWNETYKAQVHVYMLGLKLKRCLAVVYNKNTSELYTERIRLDRDYAIGRLERAFSAIDRKSKPCRKCPNKSWFEAKWCDYYKECWN